MPDEASSTRPPGIVGVPVWTIGCGGLCALVGLLVMVRCAPYVRPQRYLPDVERAGAPLVEAIDRYIERVGHPPKTLADLLPEYDASKSGTGFPPEDKFFYRTWNTRETPKDNPWMLAVWVEAVALDCDVIEFKSTTREWKFVRVR
jgi:hypothetical protein